jgi:hypothetical protein
MNLSEIASGKLHDGGRAPPRVKYLGTAYEGTQPIDLRCGDGFTSDKVKEGH